MTDLEAIKRDLEVYAADAAQGLNTTDTYADALAEQVPALVAELEELRQLRQAVRDWLTDDKERLDSAVLFMRVYRLCGLLREGK